MKEPQNGKKLGTGQTVKKSEGALELKPSTVKG